MRTDAMFFFICLILCLNQGTIWRRGRRDETKMSGFWKWKYVLQVQLNKNVLQLLLLYFIFTQICARPVLSIIGFNKPPKKYVLYHIISNLYAKTCTEYSLYFLWVKFYTGILLLYLNDPLYLFFLFSLENPNLELAIKHNPK